MEAEIDLKKLLFLGHLVKQPKMAQIMKSLFLSRTENFFDPSIPSPYLGVIPTICKALHKYDLFHYFDQWLHSSIFSTYAGCKKLIKTKIYENEKMTMGSILS